MPPKIKAWQRQTMKKHDIIWTSFVAQIHSNLPFLTIRIKFISSPNTVKLLLLLLCLFQLFVSKFFSSRKDQEHIFSTFSTCNSIAAWQKLKTYYLHDRSLDTSSIDWALRISKNQLCEIAHNLFVWSPNWDPFESVFKGHYKPPISRLFRERNTSFMQLGFCN